VGTAASLRGTGEALRRHNGQIRIVAVEPSESPVLSGGQAGAHKIDGVGAGFVVPLWQEDIADQIEQVSTEEAVAMATRLAREEGLFAGTSTGGNVIAALRLAEQLGPDATIVTVMCDTGMKYLRTYRTELSRGGVAKARWNVLANQVMIAQVAQAQDGVQTFLMDKWDGYVEARRRLLRFLADARPPNPVVITGDIHSNWVADLKLDFADPSSPTVATEFVGTSISSGGDGTDSTAAAVRSSNPHIKFFNARRGYVRALVTPKLWTSDYRVVPYVSRPGAPAETRASFVVAEGRPGAEPA